MPPSTFIPVAEDAGLINEIGRWVLAQACADAARWPSHLRVAVNLSVAQFTHGDIVEDIRAALSRAGLRPERLTVEITESLFLTESIANLDTLHRLKALEVGIAMDHFGTGYSSLSYLRKYHSTRSRSTATSSSPHETGTRTPRSFAPSSAWGIARHDGHSGRRGDSGRPHMLRDLGCAEGQGYLFSRPLPREKVVELIDADACTAHKTSRMAAA